MPNWSLLFEPHILARGRDYFTKEKVKGFTESEDSCMARVLGTHVYNVQIRYISTGYPEMSCDCPYARDGGRCKHEAAVLFYWQKENSGSDGKALELKSDKGNTYFNVGKILRNYDVDGGSIEKARELIDLNEIRITKATTQYLVSQERGTFLAITFEGSVDANRDYPVSVNVTFSADRYIMGDCFATHNTPRLYNYYGYRPLCEHQIALLLLADEYIARYNPGDQTDYVGSKILMSYRKLTSLQKIDDNAEKSRIVRLVPKLVADINPFEPKLFLSFKVGTDKLYALKNIPELIDKRNKAESFKLGNTNMVSFMDSDFDEEAELYYEIIEKYKADSDYIDGKINSYRTYGRQKTSAKDKAELSPELVDMFYDAALGKTLDFSVTNSYKKKNAPKVRVAKEKLSMDVFVNYVEDDEGGFGGLEVEAELPFIVKGRDYDYILDYEKGFFSRLEDISPVTKMLLDNARPGMPCVEFTIGKKSIPEFYYRLLPELMAAPELNVIQEEAEYIESILPPECEITYYMDADDEYITGRVSAKYGDEEIFLHQLTEDDYPLPESRDINYEQSALKALMQYLPDTGEREDIFSCEKNGDNTFNLLSEGIKDFMAFGEVRASEDFEKIKIRKAPTVRLGVSVESGILNLEVVTDDMSEEELLDLLESYRKKKKFFLRHVVRHDFKV